VSDDSKTILGATPVNGGWNFGLFSGTADRVELVLFHARDTSKPVKVIELERRSEEGIFGIELRGEIDDLLYAFRVHAPRDAGKRPGKEPGKKTGKASSKELFCDGNRLLLDPYVRSIGAEFQWQKGGYTPALGLLERLRPFDWQGIEKPNVPLTHSVLYEAHCKGMTMLHPDVPQRVRGTFFGLTTPAILDHLLSLGVTAIELLPIAYHLDEQLLWKHGLTNYWGYNPVAHFAPHPRFRVADDPSSVRAQFKTFVREYHRAGIEVILDVVFNHTGEGDLSGPTACFRGIDNNAYYRTRDEALVDWTGCGNTFNTDHPRTTELVIEALRYWAVEMQVDGFRFDLTSAIVRRNGEYTPEHPLFLAIAADPILSKVKLIAEPWDATADGYRVGQFPKPWSEWNDKYRDTVRRFWGGQSGINEFATRIAGSSDLYQHSGRQPSASVNFVTAHDGFSLRDLVSYSKKHNEANPHKGEDGASNNYSWNSGVEGETSDPKVIALRARMMRNILATLFLSNGVPMLLGGDELERTQGGNNNAYCHDAPWNYLDWSTDSLLPAFVAALTSLRSLFPWVQADRFFSGSELRWFTPSGRPCAPEDWDSNECRPLIAHYLSGIIGGDLVVIFNPTSNSESVAKPEGLEAVTLLKLIDTAEEGELNASESDLPLTVSPSSLVILRS